MNSGFDFQPVIIIGAGRSGTNMLRDLLVKIPGTETWPCDEINYVWRHYNATVPHDEFTQEHATPDVIRFIRGAFRKAACTLNCQFLVEKTCANSLRVDFVDAVIPEAKYLFLVRDGRDVVLSAMKRWRAALDLRYVLKKLKFVPLTDGCYYAFKYAANRLHRLTSSEKRLATWGPRFEEIDQIVASHPLDEICAYQWKMCVDRASEALSEIAADRVLPLFYEQIVRNPRETVEKLTGFLGYPPESIDIESLTQTISAESVGRWKQEMTNDQLSRVENLIGDTLNRFGYETQTDGICFKPAAA